MERWSGKVAIITGASAGIGEALVESLVKVGMQVVGLARRVDRIREKAADLKNCKGKLHAFQCDVTNEEDIIKAFQWATKNVGPVHVLINNAGVLHPTNLIAGDTSKWRAILETNVLGLCIATREAITIMMANKIQGLIIHINSISGQSHLYFPTFSVYGASKHAVTNLANVLRQELVANKSDIKVTSISPGIVKTDLISEEAFKDLVHTMPMLDCEDVSNAVLYVMGTPHRVHINELIMRPVGSDL